MHWRQLGASTTHNNADVILQCDIIFLAVKPNIFPEMMAGLEIDGIQEDPKAAKNQQLEKEKAGEEAMSPQTR